MKLPIAVSILLFFVGTAFAQQKREYKIKGPDYHNLYNKEWIGPHGEYLKTDHDSAYLASPGGGKYALWYNNDMLTLTTYGEVDSFSVLQLKSDTLILKAANKPASRQIGTDEALSFVRRAALIDPHFSFQKVFFSSRGGMVRGNYGAVQVEVDSSGGMLFSCTQGKLMKSGTFKGQLSPEQLKKLNELIKKSIPERISGSSRKMIDAPTVELKVWYKNTKTGFFGPVVPWLARDVEYYVSSFINTVKLEKVSDDFGIGSK